MHLCISILEFKESKRLNDINYKFNLCISILEFKDFQTEKETPFKFRFMYFYIRI